MTTQINETKWEVQNESGKLIGTVTKLIHERYCNTSTGTCFKSLDIAVAGLIYWDSHTVEEAMKPQ